MRDVSEISETVRQTLSHTRLGKDSTLVCLVLSGLKPPASTMPRKTRCNHAVTCKPLGGGRCTFSLNNKRQPIRVSRPCPKCGEMRCRRHCLCGRAGRPRKLKVVKKAAGSKAKVAKKTEKSSARVLLPTAQGQQADKTGVLHKRGLAPELGGCCEWFQIGLNSQRCGARCWRDLIGVSLWLTVVPWMACQNHGIGFSLGPDKHPPNLIRHAPLHHPRCGSLGRFLFLESVSASSWWGEALNSSGFSDL